MGKSAKKKVAKAKKKLAKAKGAKKKMKKAQKSHKKAVKKASKAVKNQIKKQLHKNCKCNGVKDKKGHGGACKNYGWRMPWCYVSTKCEDRAAHTRGKLKWIPGCH